MKKMELVELGRRSIRTMMDGQMPTLDGQKECLGSPAVLLIF